MKFTRSGAALSLLVVTAVVLSGCGGNSGKTSSSSASSAAPIVPVNCGGKKKILAGGSTAQKNAMEQFVYAYIRACPGHTLDYAANGSGEGIKAFLGGQIDFAGSDSPMKDDERDRAVGRCTSSPAWHIPVVFGPVAVTFNINGVTSLNLDGPTTAKIFNGAITRWDDPAIKALNSGVTLPATPIHVVFRADESGTTDNFQKYLDAASDGAWGKGAGKTFNGGVGEGAVGNDGTSQAMKRTDGSITYNEWSFAEGHQLAKAQIITSAGPQPVSISAESVGKTIANPTFKPGTDEHDLIVDTSSFYRPGQPGAYPIVLVTYEIVCSKYPDGPTGEAVKAFMQATIGDGQIGLQEYGYIPLPDSLRQKLIPSVNAIG